MRAFAYLAERKGEFFLVLLSVWAVSCVAMNGFFLDSLTSDYGYGARLGIAAIIDAVLLLALYAAAGMRESKVLGIVAFALISLVIIVGALGISGGEDLYADAEGNYLYLALVLIICSLACFLLTRTMAGCMVWVVVATFTCSLIQAFYLCEEIPLSIAATVSAISIVVYHNFSVGLRGSQLGDGKTGRFALPVSLGTVLAAGCIALGVWYIIIAPLNPGVLDVKLVTEYRRLPIEEVKGTAQEYPIINYDLVSGQLVEGDYYTTDDLQVDDNSDYEVDATSIQEQLEALGIMGTGSGSSSGGGTKTEADENDPDQMFDPFSYTKDFAWILLIILAALLVIGLIVAFFVLRRRRRVERLRGWLSQPPKDQIVYLYRWIYERLRRLGFSQPEGMTLMEYAHTSARSMDMITADTGVSFERLTETYTAVVYGDYEPTEDDVVPFASYYLHFWKAARNRLGRVRYFFKSFRL